jgi:glycosyltransferase involved in cell wall biosynthesis
MQRIFIFLPSLESGGAEKQSLILAKVLKSHYDVCIIILRGNRINNRNRKYLADHKIDHIPLQGILFTRLYKFYKLLKYQDINIIFAYLASCNFFAGIIGRIAGTDFVVGGIRNSVFSQHKLIVQKFLHNHLLDYSISNNYAGVDNLVDLGFNKNKFVVIPNCIEYNRSPVNRNNQKILTILSVGRFVPQKDYYSSLLGIKYLIENLLPVSIKIRYTIIGHGILYPSIKKWIAELNLDQCVDLITNPDNLDDYYEKSDIFLSTSIFEGFSNVIMEAMTFNLPIVATDVGDNRKLVQHGESGLIAKSKDFKDIAEKLYMLAKDEKLRENLGINGYNSVFKNYGVSSFKKSYMSFITERLIKQSN